MGTLKSKAGGQDAVQETIPLSQVKPPRYRLRSNLGDMDSLKASVKSHGILQPIAVRKVGEHYEVIAGHRRFTAAHELGLKTIEAVVFDMDDKSALEAALVENLERHFLDPIEEARAFQAYVVGNGYGSQQELAKKLNRSPAYVAKRLDLLSQSEETQEMVSVGKLPVSHAEEMKGLTAEQSTKLAEAVVKGGLDAAQTKAAATYTRYGMEPNAAVSRVLQFPNLGLPKNPKHFDPVRMAREQIEMTLRNALSSLDENINILPEGAMKARYTREIRYALHELINACLRLKKEFKEKDDG